MKNKEKRYTVNIQEDEDGYTLYPGNANIDENVKGQQHTRDADQNYQKMNGANSIFGGAGSGDDSNYKARKLK